MSYQLTKEESLELVKTEWWKNKTPEQIVKFQLFQERVCMPFDDFVNAVSIVLKRVVTKTELVNFSLNIEKEFLNGAAPPTIHEIIDFIPEIKGALLIAANPDLNLKFANK